MRLQIPLVILVVVAILLDGGRFNTPAQTALAASPAMKLSTVAGAPGTSIKATISGFAANARITLRFDQTTIANGQASGRGRLTITVTAPEATGGAHTLRAESGRTRTDTVFEINPALSAQSVTPRQTSTNELKVGGFGASERVVLWLVGKTTTTRFTTIRTNSSGSALKTVTIPATAELGTSAIEARGESGAIARVTIKVKAAPVATTTPSSTSTPRATSTPTPQPTASPTTEVISIWVDPSRGSNSNSGSSRGQAVKSLNEAWNRIPMGQNLSSTYRIRLVAGTYPESGLPNYMESRYGTSAHPITIEAADENGSAVIAGSLNIYDVRYLTLDGLTMVSAHDVVHCEQCNHFAIVDSTLDGQGTAQETLKVNQSTSVTIEGSTIGGAWDNAIDFVAVQHGSVTNNRIHHAEDWCFYVKGGSADIWIEGNEIDHCGTGGFTAGQGTGFQFMVAPYLTYEATDINFIRNSIHDTDGAGMGVNGGKNILLAENSLTRIGRRSHLLEIGFGLRSCDGNPGDPDRDRCASYLEAGGWGTTRVDNGSNAVRIPNKDVTVRDNVFINPSGYESAWQHFSIAGPYSGSAQNGSNAPKPAYVDDGLVITGNTITNGSSGMSLGLGDSAGCQPDNPTCNESQLLRDNDINGA